MPFTPFHFGPGLALHSLAPRQISLTTFVAANVLTDVEPLWYMCHHEYPLHRFCHTFLGAALVALATIIIYLAARFTVTRWVLFKRFRRHLPTLSAAIVGAWLGTYTHVILDSIMHPDMAPWQPWSTANPFYQLISTPHLHWLCLGLGLVGGLMMLWRWLFRSGDSKDTNH